jgi:hypothetical protein
MDSSISAYSAYSLMAANEQQCVPVWDSRADRYCGTLTTTDLLQLILLCSDSKEHESCVQGMRDIDLDNFISNYSRSPWGEQVPAQSRAEQPPAPRTRVFLPPRAISTHSFPPLSAGI